MLNTAFFERASKSETFYLPSLECDVAWSVVELGDLALRSGQVCACDPLVDLDARPFLLDVGAGDYPVRLYLANIDGDERIAYAALWFSSASPVSWEAALREGQDAGQLKPGEMFGYAVDSGTGCFQTPEGLALLAARMDSEPGYVEHLIDAMQATYADTRSWARVQPDPAQPFSFPVFSTGFGDGVYTSYLGRDASGSPVCLVTDFDVAYVPVSEPTPEPVSKQATTTRQPAWWRFWHR